LVAVSRFLAGRAKDLPASHRRENKNKVLYNNFFFFEDRAFNKIMWKNVVEPGRPQMKIWRMHAACWIPRATNTHSDYVTLTAFPLQQSLKQLASILSFMYIACLVIVYNYTNITEYYYNY